MKSGTTTAGVERSPAYRRRQARRRRVEDATWAAKSGPVTVSYVTPDAPLVGRAQLASTDEDGAPVVPMPRNTAR